MLSASTNAWCVGQRWVPQANKGSMYATERVSFQAVLMPGVQQCLHRRSKVETAPTLLTQMQKMWSDVHEEGCRTYVIIEWYINMIFGLSYITHVPSEIGWYFALKQNGEGGWFTNVANFAYFSCETKWSKSCLIFVKQNRSKSCMFFVWNKIGPKVA